MAYKVLRCPYCGAGDVEQKEDQYHCTYCDCVFTDDSADQAYKKICEGLNAQMRGAIDEALLREHEEKYYNLRTLLWEKAHAKYIDSEAIVSICREIKKLAPQDFLASFFEVANTGTPDEVERFLNDISVKENELFIDLVLDFMLKSMNSKYIMPTAYLIERAYKNSDLKKFEEYTTRLESEAAKVESGIYSTLMPRDVFIAYSSRDIEKVMELMKLLEANGLSCFVAMRNLQHGRGAVANYSSALRAAIDNSKCLVFVSSKNSRSFSCDALTQELKYIREKELSDAPPEYKNNYVELPYKYKKMRVEYRLDNVSSPTDRFVSEFFAGLDYCETPEKVLSRITDYNLFGVEEKKAPVEQPAVKETTTVKETPVAPKTEPKRVEVKPAPVEKPKTSTKVPPMKTARTKKVSWIFFIFMVVAVALGAVEMNYATQYLGGWGIFLLGVIAPLVPTVILSILYTKPLKTYEKGERNEVTTNGCLFIALAFLTSLVLDCFYIHSTSFTILKILISLGINLLSYMISLILMACMDSD
jgi:hypothetical protein